MTLCPAASRLHAPQPAPAPASREKKVVVAPVAGDEESTADRRWNRVTGAAVILVVFSASVLAAHFAFVWPG